MKCAMPPKNTRTPGSPVRRPPDERGFSLSEKEGSGPTHLAAASKCAGAWPCIRDATIRCSARVEQCNARAEHCSPRGGHLSADGARDCSKSLLLLEPLRSQVRPGSGRRKAIASRLRSFAIEGHFAPYRQCWVFSPNTNRAWVHPNAVRVDNPRWFIETVSPNREGSTL
jgi:hypothetical protein